MDNFTDPSQAYGEWVIMYTNYSSATLIENY